MPDDAADQRLSPQQTEQLDLLTSGADYGDADLARAMRRELGGKLAEGRRLTVYLGVDPTSPNIHLGHCVVLSKLRQFQDLGHRVIFVIGDFTALIGDPTGRSKTRPPLTPANVSANAHTYSEQAFRVLDRGRTELVHNSEWLAPITLRDVVDLTKSFTIAQLLAREDFAKRFGEGTPIHLHEFLYALLQGQDAAHLRADVQLGGSDQLFNIMTGREVQRAAGIPPQVAIIMPILPGTDGKVKMSKSYGNDIGLTLEPADMYGKVMSLPDDAMPEYARLASGWPAGEAEAYIASVRQGALHPRDAKMQLARTIVGRWHGDDAAGRAEGDFVARFQLGEVPEGVPDLAIEAGLDVAALVVAAGASSRAEAKRLVQQGAVELDGTRLADWGARPEIAEGALLRVGKRGLFRLRLG